MIENIQIIPKSGYLHVRASGRVEPGIGRELWRLVAAAARRHDCSNLLLEDRFDRRLPIADICFLALWIDPADVSRELRIGIVTPTPPRSDNLGITTRIAREHGFDAFVSADAAEVEQWLIGVPVG